jgi:proline dehydrogenase
MGLARNALLWISESRKLRESLPKNPFIRKAVSRFMPGEQLEDALQAAERLKEQSIRTVFTHLGENVTNESEAEQVSKDYLDVLDQIHRRNLDTYISLKLTQLGLDLSEDLCLTNLEPIVEKARSLNTIIWFDMEQSSYVDRTISIYKKVHTKYSNVGLCLQAYLYRTERDLEDLFPLAPTIRLVKGAYKEPEAIAYRKKSDVDANYFRLTRKMLERVRVGVRVAVATHDMRLTQLIQREAQQMGLSKKDYEFQLLYGIQAGHQLGLARDGYRVRVLISYGTYWFPWYVRRLAERPANVFFVVRKMFAR